MNLHPAREKRALKGLRWAITDTLSRYQSIPRDLIMDQVDLLPGSTAISGDAAYVAFEDVFYDHNVVVEKMRLYTRLLREELPEGPANRKVVDLGAGRGELLEQLRDAGFDVTGVEINELECARLRARGFKAANTDAVSFLASIDDESVFGLAFIQVIEHCEPDYVSKVFDLAVRKLRPGGLFIVETVNSKCLWVHHSFWLDVTHRRMYPAETVQFYLGAAGFRTARVVYRQPVGPRFRMPHTPEADYGDYAIIARR
jgi:SAM-dependent methyltransferase